MLAYLQIKAVFHHLSKQPDYTILYPLASKTSPFLKIAKHLDKSKTDVLGTSNNLIKFLSNWLDN